ncbi:bifunctional DNA-formamidopyrimidine glycosylase/DNA-(apurinic or apyrimidinic site) lyase [Aliiroseovarius crassostreae]|uniref:Formamidopyrimidine-DNA glycosylase n=1 Tax=Aliiroseovarius crassostreae TaxID=154981 RepID=A0A9Q9H8D6_9RHOB|nr:bifunctional DNA-formamidopyrimidine glycosylase/DNA-(apurinic or apyrimidinic site) lyase [Aliiroseovarius crassostreae]UWP95438.1 bifunctional DNA-formamidopyrimidine glycosylase/DNA-(apurinic or apyrimidinic site) lyase [Aliiroseovarius crassostreae]
MPELPEVETVRRGLAPVMEGVRIARAEVRRDGLRWPFPDRMADRLTGAQVRHLGRRSKYLLLDLDTDETLIVHLGMSGRMLISGHRLGKFHHTHPAPEKHDHVVFDMENSARVTFNDPRRFGAMDLCPTAGLEAHKLIRVLGPEPLGNDFDETYLAARLAGKNTAIKTALLDQGILAGLGNIYVCEVLFRAGIHPTRKAGQIAAKRVAGLVPIIRDVLTEAIKSGGSSLKDYRQTDGDLGYFQHSFQVYGRENEPCVTPDCKGKIARIVQGGRSSFYCGQCQR